MYIKADATFSNRSELNHLPQATLNAGQTAEVNDDYGAELIRLGLAKEVEAPSAATPSDGDEAAGRASGTVEGKSKGGGGEGDTSQSEEPEGGTSTLPDTLTALGAPHHSVMAEQGVATLRELQAFVEEHPEDGAEAMEGIGPMRAQNIREWLEDQVQGV